MKRFVEGEDGNQSHQGEGLHKRNLDQRMLQTFHLVYYWRQTQKPLQSIRNLTLKR